MRDWPRRPFNLLAYKQGMAKRIFPQKGKIPKLISLKNIVIDPPDVHSQAAACANPTSPDASKTSRATLTASCKNWLSESKYTFIQAFQALDLSSRNTILSTLHSNDPKTFFTLVKNLIQHKKSSSLAVEFNADEERTSIAEYMRSLF